MRIIKRFLIGLVAFVGLMVVAVQSQPVAAAAQTGDFSVKAVLPTNQLGSSLGYFNLLVKPEQTQTISVALTNSAAKQRTFDVYLNPAVTSDGGTIDYGQRSPVLDKTLPFDVRQVVKLQKNEYVIPAKTTINVPLTITMPAKKFAGRVIAGINVSEKLGKAKASSKNGVTVRNPIAYNLAVVLQESTDKITPDLKLLSGKVAAVNSYPTVQFKFRNPTPTIINDLVFTTKLYRDGKLYVKNTSNTYLVAPNSAFHLNLDLGGNRVQPSEYRADIVARSGSKYTWHFKTTFTVNAEAAAQVNHNSIFKDKAQPGINWLLIIIILLLIILLLLIIFFILWKRRKDKDEDENEVAQSSESKHSTEQSES